MSGPSTQGREEGHKSIYRGPWMTWFVRAVLALVVLGILWPWEYRARQDFYFLMEFDAEIEGERFAFETKIACKPRSAPTGTPGATRRFFSIDRHAFGKKLKSGKGAFVAAPDICEWYFGHTEDGKSPRWSLPELEKSILPSIYITDDYEYPVHMTFYSNPNGPDPKTGVRLIRCVVKPLSFSEAPRAPERLLDVEDPFLVDGESSLRPGSWHAFSFYPLTDLDSDRVRGKLGEIILETGRYRLHRQPGRLAKMFPGIQLVHGVGYWPPSKRNGIDRRDRRSPNMRAKRAAELKIRDPLARKALSMNLPIRFDGKAFSVDFETTGVLYAFSNEFFYEYLHEKRNQRLNIAGVGAEFDWAPVAHELLVLHDLKTGRLYVMDRPILNSMS